MALALSRRKLSTGGAALPLKTRTMPAGKDMVSSPVTFTRQLPGQDGGQRTPQVGCSSWRAPPGPRYLSVSCPLKYAWTYSVKAVATGSVSCEPSTTGLGPRDSPGEAHGGVKASKPGWDLPTTLLGWLRTP